MREVGYSVEKNGQTFTITNDLEKAKRLCRSFIDEGHDSHIEVFPAARLSEMTKLSWDQEVEQWVGGPLP
ncbi:hypothetical protein JQX09_15660 [Sulfitobacter pseudonitzschiae]|uniref:hypothetical protein n=1 Tax=Pseudosulfitobacter pseudonitzschiae TaxID=1402135 RepID=UPI001AF1C88D|nr:hypothetical protein [Pseudosulfitobacter pseudonitzschiae]MBM2293466.1 hypothetical protein [Pseudosulfitobacter pseudonitzschiae]MBM2298280.1 hypothetical protein [Pseudosulfitobacter pseudonitzschiae]MBM2312977.1 hypothetical protein [Pseudosulfitobacter pseudonitzschiae]MBM2317890.1 hypothetical protein [Pseudosulfitobacter pseudonitzschiae]MBM2327472.1 hypothetical protein [Pseudosulfitobacter pseudonitzschiae]